MTGRAVRTHACSLLEVTEEPHFEFTSFRVRGKIFATMPPGEKFVHLFVSDDVRTAALARHGGFLEELHWGRKIAGLRATLASADAKVIKQLLTDAWKNKASKTLREAFRVL